MTEQYILVEHWLDSNNYERISTLEKILTKGVRLEGAQPIITKDSVYVPVAYVRYDKIIACGGCE
jgi:hypothetical protein